jgi:hypothetical protein
MIAFTPLSSQLELSFGLAISASKVETLDYFLESCLDWCDRLAQEFLCNGGTRMRRHLKLAFTLVAVLSLQSV